MKREYIIGAICGFMTAALIFGLISARPNKAPLISIIGTTNNSSGLILLFDNPSSRGQNFFYSIQKLANGRWHESNEHDPGASVVWYVPPGGRRLLSVLSPKTNANWRIECTYMVGIPTRIEKWGNWVGHKIARNNIMTPERQVAIEVSLQP
jgi:hypothetical protein